RLNAGSSFQVALGRTENLRQDRRKRQQKATGVLPAMWNAYLCNGGRSRPQGLCHPRGLHSSTRPDRPPHAVVVSLRAAMAHTRRVDANVREAALDRSNPQVTLT